jgi:hypothetical protein
MFKSVSSTDKSTDKNVVGAETYRNVFSTSATIEEDSERKEHHLALATGTAGAFGLMAALHWPTLPTSQRIVASQNATVETIPDKSKTILLEIFEKLSRLRPEDLETGTRMERMTELLSDPIQKAPAEFCNTFLRVMSAHERYISSDAKAAALRYLGIYETPLLPSALTQLFLSALELDSEEEVTAAARSLGDMGDRGAIPAIAQVALRSQNPRAQRVMQEAIRSIEGADDAISRSQT